MKKESGAGIAWAQHVVKRKGKRKKTEGGLSLGKGGKGHRKVSAKKNKGGGNGEDVWG